jgi:bacteriorhodopsin
MVFCEMTGAQADINTNKHAMETIFLIIIDLAFQTAFAVFFIDESNFLERRFDYKKKYYRRQ